MKLFLAFLVCFSDDISKELSEKHRVEENHLG